jgi:hypothetical protein
MMPGVVIAFAGPNDGESISSNEADWQEEAANHQKWKGYTFRAAPDGTLQWVRYKKAKPHEAT